MCSIISHNTFCSFPEFVVVLAIKMRSLKQSSIFLVLLLQPVCTFTVKSTLNKFTNIKSKQQCKTDSNKSRRNIFFPLFMGRAAAVRASTKAKTDGKKAKINAVFGKKIIMAVKDGGSADPNANRALFDVIKQAKANSVPIDNINRAIKKASEGNVGDFKESTYEVYGFGGASMIINVLTDNMNRASSDLRVVVNKQDGKIAEPGSVLFMYDRKGKIEVSTALDEERVLEAAVEGGCDDYELFPGESEDSTIIYTSPRETSIMIDAIKTLGDFADDAIKQSLVYLTKAPVDCSDEDFEKNMQLIDALEDLDDVDSVEHNMSN
jgi:YebC/PmpR family DNA-binding regulatory protein